MTVEELIALLGTLPKTATVIVEAWPMDLFEALKGTADGDIVEFGIACASYERGEAVIRLDAAPQPPAPRVVAPGPTRPQ